MWWREAVVLAVVSILVRTGEANQPPIFTQGMDFLTIPEDTSVGSSVYTLSATDADGDPLTYGGSGQVSNELFSVDPTSGVVTLEKELDRELTDEYILTVTVTDGTNLVQQNPTIFITDANDNSPVFQGVPYQVDVDENDMTQPSIFRMTATDADQGQGGTVYYEPETGDATKFAVIRTTGVVSLLQELDYEEQSVYQLRIKAEDGGGSLNGVTTVKSTTTVLIVNVLDEDDTPPVFIGQPFSTQVDEDTPVGTSTITINAHDGDIGINDPIIYSTEGDDGTFSIDATTGVITLAKMLDRESKGDEGGVYSFTVQAQENSNLSRSANTNVRITVVDVNDDMPTFYSGNGNSPQSSFTATIPEGTSAGIPLGGLDMWVEDNDEGDNGRFALTLDEEGSKYFKVVPSVVYGQAAVNIRVQNSSLLDYETLQSVLFEVIAAEDWTHEHFSSNATVLVTLEDVNDNSPVFNQSRYDLSVAENSPDGTVVGTITAVDMDSALFGEISYSLQGSGSDKFTVNRRTGEIRVAKGNELDRETIPSYFLTLLAEDGGGRASNVQMQISLQDVNDVTPTFYRSYHWKMFIHNNTVEPGPPLQLLAVDIDEGSNKDIKYSIIGGNEQGIFTIDGDNGAINLAHTLGIEAFDGKGEFHLVVQAKDEGQPPLSSTTTVIVVVEVLTGNEDNNYVCQSASTPCLHSTCQNGGNCSSCCAVLHSYCTCPAGYTGNSCEIDINECASSPCQNGGSCLDGINSYSCQCMPGFAGDSCQSDIDECASSPCQNGGTCFDGINFYRCNCMPGFVGDNCESDIDWCAMNPCPFDWDCEDQITHFSCHVPGTFHANRLPRGCGVASCPNGMSCNEEGPLSFSCSFP